MRKLQFLTLLGISLHALSQPLFAQEEEQEKKGGWTGKGELGFVQTTGNTDTSALNMALEFVYEKEKWRHRLGAKMLQSEKNGIKDAERYTFDGQSDYKFSDKSYVFGSLRHDIDKFAGFEPVTVVAVGYGHELIDNGNHYLLGEIGAGYRSQENRLTGESEDGAIARGRFDYKWTISETTELGDQFLVESGSDNTFVQNNMNLAVAINSRLAVKLGYEVRYNSKPPPGTLDDTDTVFTTNLVYHF